MSELKDFNPNALTSTKALEAAVEAVTLVRDETATNEQLKEELVKLAVIVTFAVETITGLQAALSFKKVISVLDTEGHEVPDRKGLH